MRSFFCAFTVALASALSGLPALAGITEGLVGYWPFDEELGITAADATTNSNSGFLNKFPTDDSQWVAGQIGSALRFRGPDFGDYVRVPNYPKPEASVTVAGWVRADARPTWASIAKNWGGSQTGQLHFGLRGSDGDLSCYLTTGNGVQAFVSENRLFPVGSWEHVAFTADGNSLRLYRNGSEVSRASYTGTLLMPPISALGLGVKLDDAGLAPDPGAPGFWQGEFDDLAIWSRALSPAEIAAIFAAGQQGLPLTDAKIVPARPGPAIGLVGHTPATPGINESLSVTCSVAAVSATVTNVTLHWRLMFGPLQQTSMSNVGGVFSAVLPNGSSTNQGWHAGDLLRWFITATDELGGTSRWPLFTNATDSAEYMGTVVEPAGASTSALPVLHWFVESPPAADTDAGTRCCLFFNSRYYDNISVRIRGGTSRSWPKKSYKFEFNPGERFFVRAGFPQVKEFDLNTTYTDKSYVRSVMAAEFQRDSGLAVSEAFHMQTLQNGRFYSVAIFVEQPNEQFLRRHQMDTEGALYKALGDPLGTYEKKTRLDEDDMDLQALMSGLKSAGTNLQTFIFDNLSLPNVVNYMATVALTQNIDASDKNHFLYHDTNGTREWRLFPWDLDLTFGPDYLNTDTIVYNYCDLIAPHCPSHPFIGARPYLLHSGKYHLLLEAIVKTPRAQQMLLCRIRTLADQFLASGYFQERLEQYYNLLDPDVRLDKAKWLGNAHFPGKTYTLRQGIDRIKVEYLAPRLGYLTGTSIPGIGTAMPESQPADLVITLGKVEINPLSGNQDEEFVQLLNTNAVAADISGWRLTGAVEFTFAAGTVIPAGEALYASPNAAAFRGRAQSPTGGESRFVQGNYVGRLSSRGESLALNDSTGRVICATNLPGTPSPAQQHLRVTEIMYHPSDWAGATNDPGLFEFIELRNTSSDVSLNLSGVRFTAGISFDFTGSLVTNLAPGQTVVVVRDVPTFLLRYGPTPTIAGQYAGALDNAGERLRLEDSFGEKILEFAYNPSWYPITDGFGCSLVVVDDRQPWYVWSLQTSWRPSSRPDGSPGRPDDPPVTITDVRLESGNVLISVRLRPGLTGQIEFKDQLGETEWRSLPDTITGTGENLTILDINPAAACRFYRIRAW